MYNYTEGRWGMSRFPFTICISAELILPLIIAAVLDLIEAHSRMFCDSVLTHLLLLPRPFPYLSRRIEFSITTFSGLVLIYRYSFRMRVFSSFLIISLHNLASYLSVSTQFNVIITIYLPHYFSPHGLTISVSLLLFSHLCLPHLL